LSRHQIDAFPVTLEKDTDRKHLGIKSPNQDYYIEFTKQFRYFFGWWRKTKTIYRVCLYCGDCMLMIDGSH
jgi:hypothetical protein